MEGYPFSQCTEGRENLIDLLHLFQGFKGRKGFAKGAREIKFRFHSLSFVLDLRA